MSTTDGSCSDTRELIRRSHEGDASALDDLFSRHRPRLVRMVRARLDWRLQGRIDPEDVVQAVLAVASCRLASYLRDPRVPFFLWLRLLTGQEIVDLHRHHLGAKARDVRREVPLLHRPLPEATSRAIAAHLLGTGTTPSRKVMREQTRQEIQEALERLDPRDREVLVLRHYENLSNREIAHELGIRESAASKRYFRALTRIQQALRSLGHPGTAGGSWPDETT